MTLILLFVSSPITTSAQRLSMSTDIFKLATLSPNLSVDLILSPNLSLNVGGVLDLFENHFDNFRLKQVSVSPKLRYWFKRPLYSHYLGTNILASMYNLNLNNNRRKGKVIAIGLEYGYGFLITKRLSLIPCIGIGYGYVLSEIAPELNKISETKGSFNPMLTRIGLSLSYILN